LLNHSPQRFQSKLLDIVHCSQIQPSNSTDLIEKLNPKNPIRRPPIFSPLEFVKPASVPISNVATNGSVAQPSRAATLHSPLLSRPRARRRKRTRVNPEASRRAQRETAKVQLHPRTLQAHARGHRPIDRRHRYPNALPGGQFGTGVPDPDTGDAAARHSFPDCRIQLRPLVTKETWRKEYYMCTLD
jgi:hypothetical protein